MFISEIFCINVNVSIFALSNGLSVQIYLNYKRFNTILDCVKILLVYGIILSYYYASLFIFLRYIKNSLKRNIIFVWNVCTTAKGATI